MELSEAKNRALELAKVATQIWPISELPVEALEKYKEPKDGKEADLSP